MRFSLVVGRICRCSRQQLCHLEGGASEQSYSIEHTFHVQIHHLGKRLIRVRVEFLAPRCARIGE